MLRTSGRSSSSIICLLNREVAIGEAMLDVETSEAIEEVMDETVLESNAIVEAMEEAIEEHRADMEVIEEALAMT